MISSSPLTLKDYGKKLFDLINGERIVNNHHTKIEIDEHMTDYEIQKACNDFTFLNMFDELSNAERTSIYDVAYNEGIRVEAIKSLLAISFRDKLLSIRALSASNNIE